MRVEDVTLPKPDAEGQWCELLIHTATPEVGKQWADTGEIPEQRNLKGRAEGETRTVPGHPALTRILRQHIEDEQLSRVTCRSKASRAASSPDPSSVERGATHEGPYWPRTSYESPTGRRVCDNRNTRRTKWLNDGIPPAQVAEWAGNRVCP
ncbi:hypothetical protein ACQF36_13625 [Streptomyces sp. Marseille-Q5077]|uniref:hypothetical protein n=1 Tax=Streptomyces sp. Marseille-Q5077 TaxID=3418995 RepID=UPI003D05BE40